MAENPFTQIESRFDSLEQSIRDLKDRLLNQAGETNQKDIGGVEVAVEVTGLSTHSVYRLVSQRKIPHSKRLGRLYFSRKALRQWIAEGQRKTS